MPVHPFPPVYDGNSRVLILGSFPSVASRGAGFYYGHPRNRFWSVLAAVLDAPEPHTTAEKKELLLRRGVALWDAAASCEITGSSDSSIKNAVPNDLSPIFETADIKAVFCNGATAGRIVKKFGLAPGRRVIILPSTSPANAARSLGSLTDEWSVIKDYI